MKRTVTRPDCTWAQPVGDPDTVPEVAGRQCADSLQAKSELPDKSRPTTILWIDDDQLLLTFGQDILERHGYRVFTALDGPSGIIKAAQERPDLVILDVLMPDMAGYEVCRRLRAEPGLSDTPILLLTSLQDPQVDVLGRGIGATFTMTKPGDPAYIINTIEELLRRNVGPTKE